MKRAIVATLAVTLLGALAVSLQARPAGRGGGSRQGAGPGGSGSRIDGAPGPTNTQSGTKSGGNSFIDPAERNLRGGDGVGAGQVGRGPALDNSNLRNNVQEHLNLPNQTGLSAARNGQIKANYAPQNKPFTADWYKNHPNAWQYTHPHADAWAAATLVGTTAWLGWNAVPAADYGTYYTTTPAATVTQDAAALASQGSQDVLADGEWFNLGTYILAPNDQSDAAHMLTLTVNRDGILRGSYYDLLSGTSLAVQGAIDKSTQRAAWTIASQGSVTFQSTLADLTAPSTPVSVQFGNGNSQLWRMVRQTTDN